MFLAASAQTGGITNLGVILEFILLLILCAVPLVVLALGTWAGWRSGPIHPDDLKDVRSAAATNLSQGLTLAGLTFAAISFLSSASAGSSVDHETPLGFYFLAFFMYCLSVMLAKWIREWTIHLVELTREPRDHIAAHRYSLSYL